MKPVFVVYVDSNPNNVVGFFLDETVATNFRDSVFPAGEVKAALISSTYQLLTTTTYTVGL